MINPHGSKTLNPLYVADDAKRAELQREATDLPKLLVCSQAAANAVMMASGYFNPLTGFMSLADALSVCEKMKTSDGLFFPTPIVNVVSDASSIGNAKRIALYRKFNRLLHEHQPYTMLFNRYNLSLVAKRFGGVVSTPYGVLSYIDFYVRNESATGAAPPPSPETPAAPK